MTPLQRETAARAGFLMAIERLMADYSLSFDEAFAKSQQFKEQRRQTWLTQVIDPLAEKHGTSREAVISLLFLDNTIDGPHIKDAYWAEANDFALMTPQPARTPPLSC